MTGPTQSVVVQPDSPEGMHTDIQAAFVRCGPSFFRYFAARLGTDGDAVDDLMQQLWLAAATKAPGRREPNPEPWLWRIAENLLRMHWRRQTHRLERRIVADPALARSLARQFDEQEIPLEALSRRQTQEQLLLALTSLTADEQELLIGHYFEGRTHADLAGPLGVSERAVEGRLYRARRALRRKLQDLDSEDLSYATPNRP